MSTDEMVSGVFCLVPDSLPQDRPLMKRAVLAKPVDSGLFKKDRLKSVQVRRYL